MENNEEIKEVLRTIIRYIGDDPDREGLSETPERIINMWREIFRGYNPDQKPEITTFPNESGTSDMIFDTGNFYSMCEHHMLPFFGHYYFAYLPNPDGRILGISKVARAVAYCAARLQIQERLAKDVIDMLSDALGGKALGFAIVLKGEHMCKTMRGARSEGNMCVARFTGTFKDQPALREEFYKLISIQQQNENQTIK